MSGFFLLHRGWRDNPVFGGEFSRADAWVWLIENAAWKPTKARIKGQIITLERGELSFSVRFLAESWGWSKSRVDRFITELRAEGMIETRSKIGTGADQNPGQGQSIITICNYTKYQDVGGERRDNSGTLSGTTAGQQRDKEEQGNKGTREDTSVSSLDAPAKHASGKDWPDIPDWVPVEPWNGFIEMRRRKSANPTPRAVALLLKELEKLKRCGCDPGEVLDQSTKSNWTDVYKLKDNRNGTGRKSTDDNRDGFTRALHASAGIDAGRTGEPPGQIERRAVGDGGSHGLLLIAGTGTDG